FSGVDGFQETVNASLSADNTTWTFDDASRSAWSVAARADASALNDSWIVYHAAPGGSVSWNIFLSLSSTDGCTIPGGTTTGNVLALGNATSKTRLIHSLSQAQANLTENASLTTGLTWVQDDTSKPSWILDINPFNDWLRMMRIPAGSTT